MITPYVCLGLYLVVGVLVVFWIVRAKAIEDGKLTLADLGAAVIGVALWPILVGLMGEDVVVWRRK